MNDIILMQFNTAILSVGQGVHISGITQDNWYFEYDAVIKVMDATELIVTYEEHITKEVVNFTISIEDVLKGRTKINI